MRANIPCFLTRDQGLAPTEDAHYTHLLDLGNTYFADFVSFFWASDHAETNTARVLIFLVDK